MSYSPLTIALNKVYLDGVVLVNYDAIPVICHQLKSIMPQEGDVRLLANFVEASPFIPSHGFEGASFNDLVLRLIKQRQDNWLIEIANNAPEALTTAILLFPRSLTDIGPTGMSCETLSVIANAMLSCREKQGWQNEIIANTLNETVKNRSEIITLSANAVVELKGILESVENTQENMPHLWVAFKHLSLEREIKSNISMVDLDLNQPPPRSTISKLSRM